MGGCQGGGFGSGGGASICQLEGKWLHHCMDSNECCMKVAQTCNILSLLNDINEINNKKKYENTI